jgi:small subunit ribosomal protein S11
VNGIFQKKISSYFTWSSLEKWVLEVLKEHSICSQMAAEDCSKVALEAGLKSKVYVKDQETDVESAIRSLHNGGIEVTEIIDVTNASYNVLLQKT